MTNKEIISSLRGLIGKYNLSDDEWQTVEKSIEVLSDSDGDAISRNNAITSICQWGTTLEKVGKCQITVAEMKQTCADMLKELPSIQPKAKMGHWIEKDGFDGDTYYDCSECGESWTTIEGTPWNNGMKYCPNCGTKMEETEQGLAYADQDTLQSAT